jgi:hypothetical protein
MSGSTLKHQPLNHSEVSIRVLEILPEHAEGTVKCEIYHATIDARYVCLSYVWGSPYSQHRILVNDAAFYVRSNLWEVLRVTCTKYQDVTFWVDAISIDQTSPAERNHQVA